MRRELDVTDVPRIDKNVAQRWLRRRTGMRKEQKLEAKSWGSDWPLTVTEGTVVCDTFAVTFIVDGVTYALNGNARARMPIESWADGDLLRKFENGQYRPMDKLIKLALDL